MSTLKSWWNCQVLFFSPAFLYFMSVVLLESETYILQGLITDQTRDSLKYTVLWAKEEGPLLAYESTYNKIPEQATQDENCSHKPYFLQALNAFHKVTYCYISFCYTWNRSNVEFKYDTNIECLKIHVADQFSIGQSQKTFAIDLFSFMLWNHTDWLLLKSRQDLFLRNCTGLGINL